jgi:hypothetical protein
MLEIVAFMWFTTYRSKIEYYELLALSFYTQKQNVPSGIIESVSIPLVLRKLLVTAAAG